MGSSVTIYWQIKWRQCVRKQDNYTALKIIWHKNIPLTLLCPPLVHCQTRKRPSQPLTSSPCSRRIWNATTATTAPSRRRPAIRAWSGRCFTRGFRSLKHRWGWDTWSVQILLASTQQSPFITATEDMFTHSGSCESQTEMQHFHLSNAEQILIFDWLIRLSEMNISEYGLYI